MKNCSGYKEEVLKEVQEEDEEDTDKTLTKPTTEEIRKTTDTHVNFLFTENGKIGTVAMKASTLFEMELCKSMKQTSILEFFQKKIHIRSLIEFYM